MSDETPHWQSWFTHLDLDPTARDGAELYATWYVSTEMVEDVEASRVFLMVDAIRVMARVAGERGRQIDQESVKLYAAIAYDSEGESLAHSAYGPGFLNRCDDPNTKPAMYQLIAVGNTLPREERS